MVLKRWEISITDVVAVVPVLDVAVKPLTFALTAKKPRHESCRVRGRETCATLSAQRACASPHDTTLRRDSRGGARRLS